MSLVKWLPAWFHAIADYAVASLLILVPAIAGGSSKAVATGIVVGVVVAVVSMLTRYPLGVIKVLPFTVHSAGDYLAAALLVIAPFALSFNGTDTGLSAFYVAGGVAVLAVSLITNYQYSPRRTVPSNGCRLERATGRAGEGRKNPTQPPAIPRGDNHSPRL